MNETNQKLMRKGRKKKIRREQCRCRLLICASKIIDIDDIETYMLSTKRKCITESAKRWISDVCTMVDKLQHDYMDDDVMVQRIQKILATEVRYFPYMEFIYILMEKLYYDTTNTWIQVYIYLKMMESLFKNPFFERDKDAVAVHIIHTLVKIGMEEERFRYMIIHLLSASKIHTILIAKELTHILCTYKKHTMYSAFFICICLKHFDMFTTQHTKQVCLIYEKVLQG